MNPLTNTLLYMHPADRWTECNPLGNGRLGAAVYGGVNEERVCLNEDTIWMGRREDRSNPKAKEALPRIRRLLFDGKLSEAEALARETLVSHPKAFGAYTPFADLLIQENDDPWRDGVKPKYFEYQDYERRLDMSTGVLSISYTKNGIKFQREYFASYLDNVIVVHFANDADIPMEYTVHFVRGFDTVGAAQSLDNLLYTSTLCEGGVTFAGSLRVLIDKGTAMTTKTASDLGYMPPYMQINGAAEITFLISIRTDFDGNDPMDCLMDLQKAALKGYAKLKEDHIRDFNEQYSRFSLRLTSKEDEAKNTMQWLDDVHNGNITPAFAELVMNAERYLFISSSRKGSKPSNLQGVWNHQMRPSWESDYHTNINLQINYWPAHAWGLHEDVLPLIDWIKSLVPSGSQAVQRLYGTRGWTVHHASNLFGYATPVFDIVGIFPMAGPWLCRHLYDYYLHIGDREFLKNTIYPIMKGSAEFLLDFLIPAPDNSPCAGLLVTNPSMSPENIYIRSDTKEHGMFAYAPTMDIEIANDFFTLFIDAMEELRQEEPDLDTELLREVMNAKEKLPPIRISKRYGGIMEWIEDYEDEDPGHRHVSHLYGVYPGWSITPTETPDLAAAAQKNIDRKFAAGYHGQGWSLSWIACILARLQNQTDFYTVIARILRDQILPNFMVNAHGQPQVGDAMGIPAAMLEALAQSHEDEIILLPCLPECWADGEIKGMCLRGGYTLDMIWTNGSLVSAYLKKVYSGKDKTVRVAVPGKYDVRYDKKTGNICVKKR